MLKRQQVLLEHWMIDYLKELSRHMKVSCSEAARIMLCFAAVTIISDRCRGHKNFFDKKKIVLIMNEHPKTKLSPNASNRIISDFYYEARKLMMVGSKNLKKIRLNFNNN